MQKIGEELTEALTRNELRREECWRRDGREDKSEGSEKGLERELGIERVEIGFLGEMSDELGFRDKREEAEVVDEHAIGSVGCCDVVCLGWWE